MGRQGKSRDLWVSENLISNHEFPPPVFPRRCLHFVLKLPFRANWSHTKSGGKPLKRGGARVENVFCASCACVLPNRLFLVAFESWYSSGMSHLLFLQYFHKRDGLQGNWCYLSILPTFRMGESPLNWTCIFVCTPGFHCRDLKLQRQGGSVMFILVLNFRQGCMKRFQVTGTFVIAHA